MGAAITSRGAAVCAGILLTKLVGVAMLAFSRTQIFGVYYFRMYLALVLLGAVHGLLLLPVLLALLGPEELEVFRVTLQRRTSSAQPVRCSLLRAPCWLRQTFEYVCAVWHCVCCVSLCAAKALLVPLW